MSKTIVLVTAVLSIAGLTVFAISQGHNGALIALAFSFIGGLAGYKLALK